MPKELLPDSILKARKAAIKKNGAKSVLPMSELNARWKKKKEHLEKIASNIRSLRYNLTRDLKSEDEKTRLTALVISVMDCTAERVGNNKSAKAGHFGVTVFRKKHIRFDGNTAYFRYTGKKGVPQNKKITDKLIVDTLRKAVKDSPSKFIFTTSDGFRIHDDKINRYLEPYHITAKDIRGYCANTYILNRLKNYEIIKASADLPEEKAQKKRKAVFNKAVKYAAGKVGHGPATLKSHYLMPEVSRDYIQFGRIINLSDFYSKGGEVKGKDEPLNKPTISVKEKKPCGCKHKLNKPLITKLKKGGLIAPNGKPSNLTPEQYELVRTPAFKKWFGDWENDPKNASKVVDENGEPLVVYHASPFEFNVFDKEKTDLFGWHFGTKKAAEKVGKMRTEDTGTSFFIRPFFLDVKNPYLTLDIKFHNIPRNLQYQIPAFFDDFNINKKEVEKFNFNKEDKPVEYYKDKIQNNKKWDGFWYVNKYENKGSVSWIVNDPAQIKLADGSNTTFDLNNPDVRFQKGGLIAPNGKPSNLTPEQYELVRTSAFKKWFGDWENDPKNASKVVDENGEPLVVYHGSYFNFNIFDRDKLSVTLSPDKKELFNTGGFYFSNDKEISLSYKNRRPNKYQDKTRWLKSYLHKHKVRSFFLRLMNPLIIQGEGKVWNNIETVNGLPHSTNDISYRTYTEGKHDGVIFYNIHDTADDNYVLKLSNSFVVFDSSQIKLADGTNTTFDLKSPDVRFKKGGEVKTDSSIPKELLGARTISNTGFGGYREHTSGKVNLEDLKVLDNAIDNAKNTFRTDPSFKPSKDPIVVGVDIHTGIKQLLDGYHRYISKNGNGEAKAKFIPMRDGKIIGFDEIFKKGGEVEKSEVQKQIDAYIKEGIFIGKGDKVYTGTVNIDRFFGENRDIFPSQLYVDKSGVRKWKKRIKAGERPAILVGFKPIDDRFHIIDAHHRLTAYDQLGFTEVPVIDKSGKLIMNDKEKVSLKHGGELNKKKIKILYLHGIGANPESDHVTDLAADNVEIIAPYLDYNDGKQLFHTLSHLIERIKPDGIVGHSAGGFLAFYLSNKFRIPSLMFNPAFNCETKSMHLIPEDALEMPFFNRQVAVVGSQDEEVSMADQLSALESVGVEVFIEKIGHDVPDDIKIKYFNHFIEWFRNFYESEKGSNFITNTTKDEIQHIISGTRQVRNGAAIQAAASYLKRVPGSGSMAEDTKLFKQEEEDRLKTYITDHDLWVPITDFKNYVTQGAEQKVFMLDGSNVIKINDSVFYSSWQDYLNSLLIHNYFFPVTAYELIGFTMENNKLYSVVKQPLIKATEKTDLNVVKQFLENNGFVNTKNDDYKNSKLGLILEDLHDENVLTKDGILYFVDTVFYIMSDEKLGIGGLLHGSTTSFDKFRKNKIGTGTSEQQYGWGIYFTDTKSLAKYYANLDLQRNLNEIIQEYPEYKHSLAGLLSGSRYDIDRAISEVQNSKASKKEKSDLVKILNEIEEKVAGKRYLYEVTLNKGDDLDEYDYMDWDSIVTDRQKEKIISHVNELPENESTERLMSLLKSPDWNRNDTGQKIYEYIVDAFSKGIAGQKDASLFLLKSGIDGIIFHYVNDENINTTNYVVFDEKNITIENKIKFEKGGLIAPNGKPSNLTPDQYKLVRTPEFKNWFGDWENDPENSSKVIDDNGEPLVVYHGSRSHDITEFREDKMRAEDYDAPFNGFWFSDDPHTSPAMTDPLKTYSVFLNLRNEAPYFIYKKVRKEIEKEGDELLGNSRGYGDATRIKLKQLGYDGVIWEFPPEIDQYKFEKEGKCEFKTVRGKKYWIEKGKEYGGVDLYDDYVGYITGGYDDVQDLVDSFEKTFVVFSANQIKLADGTNTTFDPNNPDIRFKKGGKVDTSRVKQKLSVLYKRLKAELSRRI